ncbi:MAG TPA: type II toxin-antitoxin system RelE/ParE family toxin [Ramlibacter sp.]|uniref:type II toxin-antitoxin system RelE/ParE family toxin n=1 Tax=Ramlibacter sp. TaxID=1917967 RepID=UPI002D129F32|nr:type II toxin-antitoxin system RelE/ParE family toxin [Ramlibacter sp.]HVZ43679.1 type II toxin-antitoxin system RelE/ParE family toxin [Ramlibacter sp.]
MSAGWTVRLTEIAESDFREIVGWSRDRFGAGQARVYATTLALCVDALRAGPVQPGVRSRDEIAKGLLSLHVARKGRRGRHLLMFRLAPGEDRTLEVLRVLHDSMDPGLHLPTEGEV